jgi:TonB family protein
VLKSACLLATLLAVVLWSSVAVAQTRASTSDNLVELPVPPPSPMSPPGTPPPPPVPRNPEDLRNAICVMPSRTPMLSAQEALPAAARPQRVVVRVRHEDDGSMYEVRLDRSSGDRALDAAVLAWARRVRLCPGRGTGEGKLPIEFRTD